MENMDVNRSFWAGKRVFVTGHTGFKGSWLCLWLESLGADVTGYALAPPTSPNLFDTLGLAKRMHSIEGDVRDAALLASSVAACAPQVVFHLAAQSLVRPSYADPAGTYATNVMGTVHLLDAVRRNPGDIRAVVNVTSDKCYENHEWAWGYRETDALGGFDPYSNSKAAAELVTSAFRRSFFGGAVAVATARAGNVIGGGDRAEDRLVPDTMRAFSQQRAVVIRNPHAVRPWQHVLEPLAGYLTLAERLQTEGQEHAQAWNFGPSERDARPVQWIVERLSALWGAGARWQLDDTPRPHEAHTLRLDCSKARGHLGWEPRWNLGKALDEVVAWYRAAEKSDDMRAVTLRQINDFSTTNAR